MSNRTYLLVWATSKPGTTDVDDHWTAHGKEEVYAEFEKLFKLPNLYSASICVPIKSTDYEPVGDPT